MVSEKRQQEWIKDLKELRSVKAENEKLVEHIEALKSVCETYIPTDKMDEANSKVILLCMGNVEEIGRKLISK